MYFWNIKVMIISNLKNNIHTKFNNMEYGANADHDNHDNSIHPNEKENNKERDLDLAWHNLLQLEKDGIGKHIEKIKELKEKIVDDVIIEEFFIFVGVTEHKYENDFRLNKQNPFIISINM